MVLPGERPKLLLCKKNRKGDVKSIMEAAIKALKDATADPAAKEELLHLSHYVINEARRPKDRSHAPFSDEVLNMAAKGSILVGKPDLDFDISVLSEETYCEIAAAISKDGFHSIQAT